MTTPDYVVHNHGSLFLFEPQSDEAAKNLRDNAQEDAQFFGQSLAVEPRYALDLASQLVTEGWEVE
jgi:hypothetical protein